jgi:DNA gyrase subunit A
MEQSFIDYAMSVIVSRALPDVRDGLKPVQRRIIWSMSENNIGPTTAHRKCAKVVGDVMGNYHPHGDQAIYDALVRMGQDFSMRHQLIDPQGNFGTIDDPPAAPRYTECRLTPVDADARGIDEDTVDFEENYSGSSRSRPCCPPGSPTCSSTAPRDRGGHGHQHPAPQPGGGGRRLPPRSTTRTPTPRSSHAVRQGPRLPHRRVPRRHHRDPEALATGRGSVKMRAVADVQEIRKGTHRHRGHRAPLSGVDRAGHRQDQDRTGRREAHHRHRRRAQRVVERVGIRLVVELKRDAVPQVVLNQLYKNTPLQDSFGYNVVALVDGVPRTLNVAEMIGYYLDHQMEVIERRTRFRLDKAKARAHILEGLMIAVDNIDEVIALIRGRPTPPPPAATLIERFELSEDPGQRHPRDALRQLTALSINELREELEVCGR